MADNTTGEHTEPDQAADTTTETVEQADTSEAVDHTDVIADPTAAGDDRLSTVHGEMQARIDALRPKVADRSISNDELSDLTGLAENFRAVDGEMRGRAERREQGLSQLDSFFAEHDTDAPGVDTAEGEQPTEATSDEQATEDTPDSSSTTADTATHDTSSAQTGQPAMAASSGTTPPRTPELGATGRAAAESGNAPRRTDGPGIAVTASGGGNHAAGSRMEFSEVGEALTDQLRAWRSSGSNAGNLPVVTLRASGMPEDRTLRRGEIIANGRKLDAVTAQNSLVAAGGLCAPLAIDYSYNTVGVTGRPIRDSLPNFQADRGGIQYRPDVSPATNTASDGPRSATGIWTNEDDENANLPDDPDATPAFVSPRKDVWIVDCPDTETAEVEALTLQMEFSNVTSRFDPETVQANTQAALIWHDRFAENHLLSTLRSASKNITSAKVLGAVRDLLTTLDKVQSYYRSVHRLSNQVMLRAIMPAWVVHMIRADITRAMNLTPAEGLAISGEQIDALLRTRNIAPVWHLDGPDTTVAGVAAQQYALVAADAAVPDWPAQVEILLHAEGHFTFLDGGTLDLGIVRDSDLIDRNRYRQFTESWEGVAARGPEALRIAATVKPTGEATGGIEFPAGAA